MYRYAAPGMDVVCITIIGLGERGKGAVNLSLQGGYTTGVRNVKTSSEEQLE